MVSGPDPVELDRLARAAAERLQGVGGRIMDEAFAALMAALGLVLLHFSLVLAFKSFLHPLTIMIAIPLSVIGAAWARAA